MSADTKIAELLTELHHLIKRTQVIGQIRPRVLSGRGLRCARVCRRSDPAASTTCSTSRKPMRGCRRKTRVSPSRRRPCSPQRPLTASVLPAASPYYRTKLRGLYTTAKADAEAECR